jgi:Fis family transcriptional regulator
MPAQSSRVAARSTPSRHPPKLRREPALALNGSARGIPLRSLTQQALGDYFANLNGHAPGRLYDLVMREVEEPLFRAVLDYVEGNQSRAAEVLGINRGTLRKKLKAYRIS